jgi:hypothetical protein
MGVRQAIESEKFAITIYFGGLERLWDRIYSGRGRDSGYIVTGG